MAGSNLSAGITVSGSFRYRKAGTPPQPSVAGGFRRRVNWLVAGSGAGVATKSHQVTGVTIAAAGTLSIDLAAFTDLNGDAAAWTKLKVAIVSHDAGSVATGGVSVTGAAANALPGLKTNPLLPGQFAVPLVDSTGAGLAVTAPNSKFVVTNADGTHAAVVTIFLQGE